MKSTTGVPISLFILAAALLSPLAHSCEPTVPEMEVSARRDRLIEEQYVRKLFKSADHVVVGVVRDVRSVPDGVYAQLAEIKVERVLKGPASLYISALMYRKSPASPPGSGDEVEITEMVSCDAPYDPTRQDPYVTETSRGLFYVEGGVLVRVTHFPVEPQLLQHNVKEELRFLELLEDHSEHDG